MKRSSTIAVGIAGVLAAGLVPLTGVAVAAPGDDVTITVTPKGANKAEVCWTAYQPTNGTVDSYQVTENIASRTPATYPATDGTNVECALFNELKSGTNYRFSVEAFLRNGDEVRVDVGSFTATGYSLNANQRPKVIVVGSKVRLSGTLVERATGPAVSGATIAFEKKKIDTDKWVRVKAKATTDGDGKWAKRFAPKVNHKFRALYLGDGVGGWSQIMDVGVRTAITLQFSKNPVKLGDTFRIRGKVTKGDLKLVAGLPISLQRKDGSSWSTLRDATVKADGTYATKFTAGASTAGKYRWELRGGRNYETARSTVRTLSVS